MRLSGYKRLFETRRKEVPTRIAAAFIIAGAAAASIEPRMPALWLGAVMLTQLIDYLYCGAVWGRPRKQVILLIRLYHLVLFTVSAVYSSIALDFWLSAGQLGQVFAATLCLGAMLHSSMHMQSARSALLAAFAPHALIFFSIALYPDPEIKLATRILVIASGLLYIAHLIITVRRAREVELALAGALGLAQQERLRAERASMAKSEFLAVMSHEIRTPMNAVVSAAHLLGRTGLDAEQKRNVSMLQDASDALMGLLNDILDFSKIEAGKMSLDPVRTNLAEKLRAMVRLWEDRARQKGVSIRAEIDPEMPAAVRVDALRVQQIVFNLLSNAVKFTEAGEIVLSARWRPEQVRAEISIRDTGVGIAADRLERIFESFEQAEAATTRRYGGTGLGLAISRRLAEMMGGGLSAQSRPGAGSTFTLLLPVQPIDAIDPAPQARAPGDPAALAGKNVLAADDNEVNRLILQSLLAPHGCALTLAEDGSQAVAAASAKRFDLIVLDMQMPVMDGLEAARRMRRGGPNATTPIVALTANALDSHRAAWNELGVSGFLTKPVNPACIAADLAGYCEEGLSASASDTVAEPRRLGAG